MLNATKGIIRFLAQALISASLVFILISAPVRRVLSAVKYTIDSSDTVTDITATGVLSIGSAAIDSFLRLYPTDTLPCAQEGAMYYSCTGKVVKFYNGTSWINLAEAAEASGQIVMFDSACPSGWTEVTAFQNKFPRGHDADGTYCETGGTDTHRHAWAYGGNWPVTILMPESIEGINVQCGANYGEWFCVIAYWAASNCQYMSRRYYTTSESNIPAYREVVFCKKD